MTCKVFAATALAATISTAVFAQPVPEWYFIDQSKENTCQRATEVAATMGNIAIASPETAADDVRRRGQPANLQSVRGTDDELVEMIATFPGRPGALYWFPSRALCSTAEVVLQQNARSKAAPAVAAASGDWRDAWRRE
jgi:hypothetical protein